MFNDIIKLNYEEDFEVTLDSTYRYDSYGYFMKTDKPLTFIAKGVVGYSILKNQLICVKEYKHRTTKGLFKDSVETQCYDKFSQLEDLYVYYRAKEGSYSAVSMFVTNKLILEPPKQEVIIPENEKFLGEIITRQQIISHEDGGWCIVTYNSVTDKIIGCSERFDYK